MQKSRIKRVLKWLGVISLSFIGLSCLWSLISFYNLDAPGLENGRRKAQPVIDAIQTYHRKTGVFPLGLQGLVPRYFPTVPRPDLRHKYEYGLSPNKKAFALAFVPKGEAIGDGWYVYCSRLDNWQRTDSEGWSWCIRTLEDYDDPIP